MVKHTCAVAAPTLVTAWTSAQYPDDAVSPASVYVTADPVANGPVMVLFTRT